MPSKKARKAAYMERVGQLFDEFDRLFVVDVTNVGSKQLQASRRDLRADSVILMGKNTMIRKALKDKLSQNPALDRVVQELQGNVGFVLTRGDLHSVRDRILANKIPAPAKTGATAQCDVIVPAGPTGMPPDMTAFFQTLNIPTKIEKGAITIQSDMEIIKEGEKVSASAVTLLQKMNIKPFTYGLTIRSIYDAGEIFKPSVLDITDEDLLSHVKTGIENVAAVSLSTGYWTQPAVPHLLLRAVKDVVRASVGADYDMPQSRELRDFLNDPSKMEQLMAAAAPAAGAGAAAQQGKAGEEEKKKEEEEEAAEESDEDMGFGLFD